MGLSRHLPKIVTPEIAPTIRANHHNTADVHFVVATGNNKEPQYLKDAVIASAVKSTNQSNPRSGGTTLVVSGQTNGTNTQPQSTDTTTEKSANQTYEQLSLPQFQSTTLSLADFLVNLSRLLASGEVLRTLEAHCSLKSAASLGLAELSIYGLRTSKDCSLTMMGLPSKPLSERWMNWGMTVNGTCLTARTSESRKTGNGCSLSQILEQNPDPKYFLSEKTLSGLMKGFAKPQ